MKKLFVVLACGSLLAGFSQAQNPIQLQPGDVKVEDIALEVQQTPQFDAAGVKSKNIPSPRDWLELEVEFEVAGRDDQVVPELLFRYYVGFKDKNGQNRTLTGDVVHTNVVCGEKYFSSAYIAPSTLGELTGDFRKFQANAVAAYGVEVFYNGVVVGLSSSMGGANQRFWQSTGTEQGVLPKLDTPFALLWIDRYAEMKKK